MKIIYYQGQQKDITIVKVINLNCIPQDLLKFFIYKLNRSMGKQF